MHSLRIDTSEWISGALLIGDAGLGVLGSDIPSSGDNGAGYAYNDLSLPADADKEICGRITTWPSAGTLFAYEDTSFDFSGAPDGVYTFEYQLYVDGVATGDPTTVTLTVGAVTHAVSGALTAGSGSISGETTHVGEVVHVAEGALTGASSIIGSATRFRAHAAEGAIAAGSAQISGTATHVGVVVHEASGTLTGTASIAGGVVTFRNIIPGEVVPIAAEFAIRPPEYRWATRPTESRWAIHQN